MPRLQDHDQDQNWSGVEPLPSECMLLWCGLQVLKALMVLNSMTRTGFKGKVKCCLAIFDQYLTISQNGVSIHTAGRLLSSFVYLFIRPVKNNYDNYIDRAHTFFLSFCYAPNRLSPFFLYIPHRVVKFDFLQNRCSICQNRFETGYSN